MFVAEMSGNISWWVHRGKKALTFSWRRSLFYGNQSIDLICKLMGWFPYNKDIRHERVRTFVMLRFSSLITLPKSVLTCRKAELAFLFLFYQGFFTNILIYREAGEGEDYLFKLSLPLPFDSNTHLGISQVIAAESSLLRIASSRTQPRSLSEVSKHYATCSFKFALSSLALIAAVVKSMLKTRVTLGNISLVLLNLIKRFIFVMFKFLAPMSTQLTFIFSL